MTNLITFLDSGIPFLKSEMIEEENLNIENLTFISNQVHKLLKKSWVYPGNILYSKIGSALGKAVLYKGNLGVCNSNAAIAKIDIDEAIALPGYVVRILNSQEGKQRLTKSIISLLPRINLTDLYSFEIALPPREEQNKIAEILDTVDEAIARTSSLIIKLKQTKAGLLQDLLTRGLDEDGKLRDPQAHPEQFKDSALGRIPKDWEFTTLGTVVFRDGGIIQTGPFGSQLHAYEYVNVGVPVIMPQDIEDGYISNHQIVSISPTKANSLARHRVKLNDVVFARRGNLERCAFIDKREVGWLCGTGCLLVRPPELEINARWLAAIYQHHHSQQQILSRAVGSTMVNLNSTLLADLIIAKPDYKEQIAIVEIIDTHNTRIRTEEAYLNKLKLQKQGLMQDLLTGKVRVKNL